MAKKHVASYQKYFDGYVTVKVQKKSGKGYSMKRFYVDNYLVHSMDNHQWIVQKIKFSVQTLLSILLFILFAITPSERNLCKYITIPGSITILSLVFLFTAWIFYVSCPRQMTRYEQKKSSSYIKIWSFLSGICISITTVGCIVFIAKNFEISGITDYLCIICYLISSASSFLIWYTEKQTEYDEEENDTQLPFNQE